jgi:hypothetical protein
LFSSEASRLLLLGKISCPLQNCAIGDITGSCASGEPPTHSTVLEAMKEVAWVFSLSAFGVLVLFSLDKSNQNLECKGVLVRYFAKCTVVQKSMENTYEDENEENRKKISISYNDCEKKKYIILKIIWKENPF